jgi:hypothetical protein
MHGSNAQHAAMATQLPRIAMARMSASVQRF